MCQAYDSEYAFCTYLEQTGQAYTCPVCYRVSYLQAGKCSYCKEEKRQAAKERV